MKTLLTLLLAMAATAAHASAPPYFGTTMSTQTGTATQYLSGNFCVAASSLSAGTCAAQVDGRNATITATTFAGALSGNAATVTTNANLTGPVTSVGNATSIPGPIPQSAVNLSTVPAAGSCTLPNVVTALNSGAPPTCTQPSNVTGNAATVTTNANLTGGVTSVGNAATVVTNANLTGDVTSVGNATTAAATQANISTLSKSGGVSVTGAGGLAATYGVTAGSVTTSGPNGFIVSASSINGGGFFGDGSHLAGVLPLTGGTLTNTLNINSPFQSSTIGNVQSGESLYFQYGSTAKGMAFANDSGNSYPLLQGVASGAALPISLNPYGGNVGVGTANPLTPLDVNGATTIRGALTTTSSATVQTGGFSVLAGNVGLGIAADLTYPFRFRATTNVGLVITHDGIGGLRLGASSDGSVWDKNMEIRNLQTTFATGNVGIGAVPLTPLDVTGATTLRGAVTVAVASMTVDGTAAAYGDTNGIGTFRTPAGDQTAIGATAGYGWIRAVKPGVQFNNLSIQPDGGNVGVGTANPATKLHVSSGALTIDGSSVNPGFKLGDGSVTTSAQINGAGTATLNIIGTTYGQLALQGASDNFIDGNGGNDLRFRTAGTDRVMINSSGNIGIGTTAPATKFHMSSGTLTVDGTGASLVVSAGPAPTASGAVAIFRADPTNDVDFHIRSMQALGISNAGNGVGLDALSGGGVSNFGMRGYFVNTAGVMIGNGPLPTTTKLSVYGVITSSTTQGSVTCNAGTPVLSASCTDQHCTFAAGALATSCTYTFGTAWPKTPDCVAITNAATPIGLSVGSPSVNSITIIGAAALTGDNLTFICMGAP